MANKVKIIAGKKKKGKYKQVYLQEIVGKTVEAVGETTVPGAYGDEPCIRLYFTDKTYHGFVMPADGW